MTFICCTALVIKFPTNQNFHFCHVPDSFTYHIYLSYTSVYQSSVYNVSHVRNDTLHTQMQLVFEILTCSPVFFKPRFKG